MKYHSIYTMERFINILSIWNKSLFILQITSLYSLKQIFLKFLLLNISLIWLYLSKTMSESSYHSAEHDLFYHWSWETTCKILTTFSTLNNKFFLCVLRSTFSDAQNYDSDVTHNHENFFNLRLLSYIYKLHATCQDVLLFLSKIFHKIKKT